MPARPGQTTSVFAVVVVGPPGSGKTSVLTALHDLLGDDDVAQALIELEAVTWAHPPLPEEQSFRHLERICRLYEAAGVNLILVSATPSSADYLSAVLAAVGAADRLVVRLEANPTTLRRRIVEREPAEWSGLERLADATEELAQASSALEGIDLVCSTEKASPRAVAAEIRSACPRMLGSSGARSGRTPLLSCARRMPASEAQSPPFRR
jgi:energy-coupling factor transporter ATP-binding protein EcfA2